MRRLTLEGHYGAKVDIDLCGDCQGFWFDLREHLQLASGATLGLFEIIHEQKGPPSRAGAVSASARRALPGRLECPRCHLRLLATEDRQRATAFHYWRCGRDHGRFITFFEFLREKDFIRELDARQVADLRSKVTSVNCSKCGAPIDLTRSTVCGYCRTPLAMLDFEQVGRVVAQLRHEASQPTGPTPAADAMLGLALLRERHQVESFFSHLDGGPDWTALGSSGGIVESGLGAVVSLLKRLRA